MIPLGLAGRMAEALFYSGLAKDKGLVILSPAQTLAIIALVLGFVALTAYFAARRAARIDPAAVLREVAT